MAKLPVKGDTFPDCKSRKKQRRKFNWAAKELWLPSVVGLPIVLAGMSIYMPAHAAYVYENAPGIWEGNEYEYFAKEGYNPDYFNSDDTVYVGIRKFKISDVFNGEWQIKEVANPQDHWTDKSDDLLGYYYVNQRITTLRTDHFYYTDKINYDNDPLELFFHEVCHDPRFSRHILLTPHGDTHDECTSAFVQSYIKNRFTLS